MIFSFYFQPAAGRRTLGFIPCVDGEGGFLPEIPVDLRNKGQFANVSILTGHTNKETSLFFTGCK